MFLHFLNNRSAVICGLKPQNPEEEKIYDLGNGIHKKFTFGILNNPA